MNEWQNKDKKNGKESKNNKRQDNIKSNDHPPPERLNYIREKTSAS